MSRSNDDQLERLSHASDEHTRRVLESALEDRPGAGRRDLAIERVLSQSLRERSTTRLLPGALLLCAAATALVVLAMPKRPAVPLAAEPRTTLTAVEHTPAPPSPENAFVPCTPIASAEGRAPLIDDFEDADSRIPLLEHRAGNWFVYDDGTGTQTPRAGAQFPAQRIPGGRDDSHFGLHVQGGKFSKWGANLSIELNPHRCYDAAAYGGIEFFARGHGSIRPMIKMTQVVSEEFGGSCTHDCFDAHFATVSLSRDWQRFRLRWQDFRQAGFGTRLAFDPRSIFSVDISVLPEHTPFDYWIDDVSFIAR